MPRRDWTTDDARARAREKLDDRTLGGPRKTRRDRHGHGVKSGCKVARVMWYRLVKLAPR